MVSIRIEGYAVVSDDGMIANAASEIPQSLIADADQVFFERGVDRVDVVVHGRNSEEHFANSPSRHRIIVTRKVASVGPDEVNPNAVLWNPKGASFEKAVAALGAPCRSAAILGGTDVFGLFLNRFDIFFLSRIADVRLPGGRPIFPQVPIETPESVLSAHGLRDEGTELSDPAGRLIISRWVRSA
jgi:dihydrofolate reductase